MMKLKKGFAIAMAAGVLTGAGLGTQVTALAGAAESGPAAAETPSNVATPAVRANFATLPTAAADKTLTIHKHDNSGADAGSKQNGLEQSGKNFGQNVPGAKFKIQKIDDFDLTTNKGWQDLQTRLDAFKNDAVKAVEGDKTATYPALTLSGSQELTTGTDGTVKFSNLAPAAYYVVETEVPADYVARTRPFIVTVPLTHPTEKNKWVKDVHVYAKNDPKDEEKTVQDSIAEIHGKKAVYTIATQVKTAVKNPAEVEDYDQFVITDFFPQDRLEFAKATSQSDPTLVPVTGLADIPADDVVVSIGVDKTAGTNGAANTYAGGTALIKDTDWEFAPYDQGNPAGSPAVPASGSKLDEGRVVIKLKQAGLDKLNVAGNNDKYLTVTLKLRVKENAADQTSPIINKYDVTNSRKKTPDTPPPTTPPNDPPSSPPSYYGNVDIVKKDSDGRIAGAKFDLYTCTATVDTAGTVTGYTLPDQNQTDTKLAEDIVADGTDTPDIKGLLANDWQNGAAITNPTSAYCLVETEVPDGHELLAEPIGFQVKKDANTATIPLQTTGDIINTKKNGGFELPLTGGKGVFALLLAGAAFLILGRGYSVYAGRRKDA